MIRRFFIGALLILQCSLLLGQTKVHILSVNDMHANIDNFPKLAAVIDSLRELYPELIVLSAGDNRTGNPLNDRHPEPSRPMTELMNKVGVNASALGNHEIDSMIPGLRAQINRSNFPYLCANISLPDSMRTHVYPYKFIEATGARIGILGTIQINSSNIPDCHPDNVIGVTFTHPDSIIPKYQWMRRECDLLILLSHDGYEADLRTASLYPYFDAIIGGHSHTKIDGARFQNGVMITQAKNKIRYATLSTFEITDGKVTQKEAQLIDVQNFSKENAEVRKMVEGFSVNKELGQTLTTAATPFSTAEELANMEMDAMIAETGADIAIQNGGGVRYDTLPAGPIKVIDILKLDPFGNEAIMLKMTGKEIADFIMNDYDIDEKQTPYVGGCTYSMTVDRDTKHPTGIKIKLLSRKKFSEKQLYKVVTNSYASTISTSDRKDPGTGLGKSCSDIVIDHLRKQPSIDYAGTSRAEIILK